ncbi:alpha/beta fold hydrolase [Micromonospora sp. DT48]|uniref:alpha/beta fold hydrolase n=1 Tax=unclassified Micromonospora TaxID=2617518 RepID=UPI0012BC1533|nr:alpha/beta hydrolase [Micromonospora sp. CP22]MTK02115.1 alpha/beta hydrolase [Micromonospora sp. CP22]
MNSLLFLHDADVLPGPVGALRPLAHDLHVDVPRHPGFGTDLDEAATAWDSVGDLAQHYLTTTDDTPRHLAGAGFGGWIALEMAVRAPHRFTTLTLVSPYGVKLSGPTEPDFADILLLDPTEIVELGWADPTTCHDLRMPGYPAGLPDSDYERAFADRAALARYAWKPFLHDPRLRRWLHLITIPTLVIAGSHNRLVPPRHSAALADLLPAARYVELPHTGHYPYLERPDEFHRLVRSFLKGETR